ncbi:MAG: flippase-like domain-containing protein [Deltaproteobacteria bacterium]|nr:flippase-like domain-containing protein [Deltaproteobacteria bacterium]
MPEPRQKSYWKKHALVTILSAFVTIAVFSYLFSAVSILEVWQLIRSTDRNCLLAFVVLSLFASIFRTWRYGLMLRLNGYTPNSFALFLIVLVRNLFSDLLPARIGSTIYVILTTTRLGVPIGPALSSFTLPFFFDLLALAPLVLLTVLWDSHIAGASWMVLVAGGSLLAILSIAAIYYLPAFLLYCSHLSLKLPLLSSSKRAHAAKAFSELAAEFMSVKSRGVFIQLFVLSLMVRLGKYASLYVFLYGLLKPLGYALADLPVTTVFLGICAAEFAASLPISGIAGFGAYEGTWATVFSMLGFPAQIAKLTSIAHHLFTQAYGYALGIAALLILMLPVFHSEKRTPTVPLPAQDSWIRFNAKILGSLLTGIALLIICFALPFSSQAKPSEEALELVRPDASSQRRRKALFKKFPATIVFDSNRNGTFDIHTIKTDGSDQRMIIGGPLHEIYPDPSPDGKKIVFARAPSMSLFSPSEVWIAEADGRSQRRLSSNGTFPTFSADGQFVYFERARKKIMRMRPDGTQLEQIFPKGNRKFVGAQVAKPRISADGRFAAFISDRPTRWNIWYTELATRQAWHLASGCEPTWFAQSNQVVWMKTKDTLDGSGIYVIDPLSRAVRPLQDAPAPFGHEYFPSLAEKDRFLLFSASPSAREHDQSSANYQLFVKDLHTNTVVRITFDTATNRWPKLLLNPKPQ